MQDVYKNIYLSKGVRVVGRNLLPLALGHLHILYASDNAFITEKEIELDDILSFIYVTSLPYDIVINKLTSGLFEIECQQWGARYYRQLDIDNDSKLIDAYLSYYLQTPQTWEKENSNSSKGGSFWLMSLLTSLMEYLNLDEKELLNMPVNKALSYYITLGESKGIVDVMSDAEIQFLGVTNE